MKLLLLNTLLLIGTIQSFSQKIDTVVVDSKNLQIKKEND